MTFGAIGIAGSGIAAAQAWINTAGGNIANSNDRGPTTAPAYATQTPVFAPSGVPGRLGDGVTVAGVALGSSAGLVEPDPGSPFANAQGQVRVANVDLGQQLVELVQAQDYYQANASSLAHAKTAYQSALTLGS